jgi:hypothetical protein
MNHNPSDDSANVHPSGQAVVAGVSPVEKLHHRQAAATADARDEENQASYHFHPSLQQALGCLDIKLEDELTRFRAKQADIAATAPGVTVSEAILEPPSAADFDSSGDVLTAEIVQTDRIVPESIQADTDDTQPHRGGFTIVDGFSVSETKSLNAITTVDYDWMTRTHQDTPVRNESLDLNFSTGGEISPFHDEYSSSSQELLRQIQSGYPAATAPVGTSKPAASPTPKRNHFTPVKIGSMAAACVLAGGAAYTYLNPSILAPLTATKVVSPISTTTSSLGQSIQSPNLAANEFTDLNLSAINTIKLPTAAPATNISTATPTVNITASTAATTPAAIPFNGINPQTMPSGMITSQPRLADSLVKSLLPPNFYSFAKQSGYRPLQPGRGR